MTKKTLVYINPMSFMDTDLTVLSYLAESFRVIWFPLFKTGAPKRYTKEEIENYANKYGIKICYQERSIRDRSMKTFAYYKKMVQKIKAENPHIVYTCCDHYAFVWYLFRSIDRRIIVFGLHDVNGHSNIDFRWIFQRIKEWIIGKAVHLVTFSKGQHDILLTKYHRESTMVGMSSKNFGSSALTLPNISDGIHLLFFGNIHSYKGLDLLIQAMEELYDEGITNLHLSIYGRGRDWEICASLIRHPQLFNTNIRFIENSELPDLFAAHHFLALPYRDVTNSGPLMIAVNYAKPIFAPSIGCFKEIYNEEQGVLYNQGSLKNALRYLSSMNDVTYSRMVASCKQLQKEYSEEHIAINYVRLFEKI